MGGRLGAAPRVRRPDAAQDLAEALERGDRAGRQEVVDVRVGGAHAAGERLVAGRAGQRVEPDEPMAVAAQARGLRGDERRVAAVPAVGHDDDDATRPQGPPRPLLVERPEALADARAAGPVVDRVGDAGQGAVAVAVLEQPGDAGQARPEHERLGADLAGRRERLDEAQEQPRVALHRAADVADDDERARLLDLAPPDPVQELAAGAEVAAEHRPRREAPAVRVELVAPRPALLEARDEHVDEALGVAQLGRGHPVELAVAQHLAARVGVRGDDHALDVARRPSVVVTGRRHRDAALVRRPCSARSSPGIGWAWPARLLAVHVGVLGRTLERRRLEIALATACAGATSDRTPRRRSAGRRAGGRRWPRRPPGPARARPMSTSGQRPGEVDGGPEVDVQAGRAQRPPEPDRLAEQPPPVDLRPPRSRDDGGIVRHGMPSAAGGDLGEHPLGLLAAELADVLLVLEDDAEGLVDELGRQLAGTEREQGGRPVERLGDARHLGQVGLAQPMDEADDLAGELLRRRRARARARSRTPSGPSGSRSSGTGSGA